VGVSSPEQTAISTPTARPAKTRNTGFWLCIFKPLNDRPIETLRNLFIAVSVLQVKESPAQERVALVRCREPRICCLAIAFPYRSLQGF